MTPILQTELPELIRNEIKSIQVKDAYLIQRSKSRGLSTARVALTISRWNVQESSLARLKMRSTRHSIGTTSGSYAEPVTGHSFCCRQRAPDNEICPLRQAVLRARKELSTGFETAIDMDSSAIGQARPCRLAVTVFVLAWQPKSRRNSGRASPLRPR
ncbi:MAG TPA: hypothetical protein VER26_09315 [Xanthobacteraceae bacterium]|nr:hypothetical protein [Xanthobacteraceae bacterium]